MAIIALGLYGEAAEGGRRPQSGRPDLALNPVHGLPGAEITIQGQNWPPRALISLYIERPSNAGLPIEKRLRLGSIIASRSGAFRVQHVLPAAAIPLSASHLYVAADALPVAGGVLQSQRAAFAVDPFPTSLQVRAVGAAGEGLSGTEISVRDALGREIVAAAAGEGGLVQFSGLPPGRLTVALRRVDYAPAAAEITLAASVESAIAVNLVPAPGRRLYVPAALPRPDGGREWVGIDRASGLLFSEPAVPTPAGLLLVDSDPGLALRFDFLLAATAEVSSSGQIRPDIGLLAMGGTIAKAIGGIVPLYPVSLWYSGRTAAGNFAVASYGDYVCGGCTGLFLIDSTTGRVRRFLQFTPDVLPPIVSRDGANVYLVNWSSRSLQVRDGANARLASEIKGLPPLVGGAALHPGQETIALLTAGAGSVFLVHVQSGTVEGPIFSDKDASALTFSPDGSLVVLNGRSRQLIFITVDGASQVDFVPLREEATWVWADPSGPFIFVGAVDSFNHTVVQIVEASTREYLGKVELPHGAVGVGGR